LFSVSLEDFGRFCRQKNAPVLAVYDVGNLDEIKKYNAITMDGDGRITFFEEKPKQPQSTVTGIALYLLSKVLAAADRAIRSRGQQSRPAGPPRAMDVSADAILHVARAGIVVRHRVEGDVGRSKSDFCEHCGACIALITFRSTDQHRWITSAHVAAEAFHQRCSRARHFTAVCRR
jgi:hypothetical protein